METHLKDTVVIYHANCLDGFGAAFAAWKKFGNNASYIPTKTQEEPPLGLAGKTVYIVDYCYSKEILEALRAECASVVVLDHHESARETVTAYAENIFNLDHSGATLSWMYFHPEVAMPKLLSYVEDCDLWKFNLPNTKAVVAHLWQTPFTFEQWDTLLGDFEDSEKFTAFVEKGRLIAEQKDLYIQQLLTYTEEVEFDGHKTLAVNCARPYHSEVGNLLAKKTGTFGIVWYRYGGAFHVSFRSVEGFNVAEIAKKFGGGGHVKAASVRFKNFSDIPMKFL